MQNTQKTEPEKRPEPKPETKPVESPAVPAADPDLKDKATKGLDPDKVKHRSGQ